MTPAEHAAAAEELLAAAAADERDGLPFQVTANLLAALAHAVLAAAVELGVPHPAAPGKES